MVTISMMKAEVKMQMTMRWFGPQEDKIPLEYIRQVPG
jgi:mannonate dehydratase